MSQKFLSEVNLQALNNAATDTDRFLVSDSGTIKYRTGSQLLSDLGVSGIYVPYTGATGNVDLGTHTLLASDLVINHSSGSGVAASITKGGNGEALTINKTSGSGNAMSVTGGLTSLVDLRLSSIPNATIDTDRFIVSDSGAIKYRTGAEVLSDIGGQAALTNPVTGTGTLNFVSKFTSTGSTLGNSQIYDNGTNVGIGTTSPSYKLDVSGTGNFQSNLRISNADQSTTRLLINNTSSSGNRTFALVGGIHNASQEGFSIYDTVAAATRLVILNTGNVGIGTTSPSSELDVNGSVIVSSNLYLGSYVYHNGDTNTYFGFPTNDTYTVRTNGSDRLYINFSGNVGIGTTSPNHELVVQGASSPNIELKNSNYSNGGFVLNRANYTQQWKWWAESSQMYFSFATDESTYSAKMTIKSSGNVGIGTTSPSEELDVVGNIKSSNVILFGYSVQNSSGAGIFNDGGDLGVGDFDGNGNATTLYGNGGNTLINLSTNFTQFYFPITFTIPQGTSEVNGEVAYWGGGSVAQGDLYYYNSSGNWAQVDADAASTATGMLGIARSTGTASTVGMLLRGRARFTGNSNYTALTTVGAPLYVSTTAGGFSQTAPSGTGDIVRIIGYVQSTANDEIYFCPDNTWVEIA